jgi:hypothetical protein
MLKAQHEGCMLYALHHILGVAFFDVQCAPEPPDLKGTQEHYKMAVFLELFAMKKRESRAKKSNAGRKKTAWYRIKLTASGRDSWVQLRPDVVADLVGVSKQTV